MNSAMFQSLEELTGGPVDRERVRQQRRQRVVDLIHANPLLPGVLDYILEAKQLGLKVGIASSSSHAWVEGHLSHRGILEHFDSITGSDDVAQVKPDPELYLLSVARMGTRPGNALAIEDSAHGVTAAKGAGVFCVVVPNPMTRDLPLDHADLRLDSLSNIALPSLLTRFS